jgi:hypothetical protein
MKRITIAVLLGIAALSLTPVASYAQQSSAAARNQGYLVDRNGNPVRGRTGDCVRLARQWSQALETPECRTASLKAAPSQPSGKR